MPARGEFDYTGFREVSAVTRTRSRLIVFLLGEARDWLFAIVGLGAAFGIAFLTDSWLIALLVLAGFGVLYILALFATARWLGEGSGPGPEDGDESEPS